VNRTLSPVGRSVQETRSDRTQRYIEWAEGPLTVRPLTIVVDICCRCGDVLV
jgi:hypothetical protein